MVYVGIGIGALVLIVLVILLFGRGGGKKGGEAADKRPCGSCARVMLAEWPKCLFCGWVPPPPSATLDFIGGPLSGQTVPLGSDVTTIGSIGGNTVVLADPAVSRKHIGIRRDPAGYELADLGSSNGVYVNGQRTAKRILTAGDIIRIGTTEMVFRISK
jgi:hypothetical protein